MAKFSVILALGLLLSPVPASQPQPQIAEEVAPCGKEEFRIALEEVQRQQSEDLYKVADAVLQAGGTEMDFFRLMQQAGESGNPVAQMFLARHALQSASGELPVNGASPAQAKARELMMAAADSGYIPALVEIAHFIGSGIGASADEAEAMRYLMKACEAGSPRARAAYLLLTGRLDDGSFDAPEVQSELRKNNFYLEEVIASLYGDNPEALVWLEQAAAHGSATAPFLLGQRKVQMDTAAAGELLMLAAERHLPEALAAQGVQELNQGRQESGLRKLQLSFMLGYVPAVVTVAAEYMKHPETYGAERVYDLYTMGAALHDGRASVARAYCLVTGRGCSPAPEMGVNILHQLAENGNPFAYVALADLYFNGCGVTPNMMKAVSYLGEAAAAGFPNAYVLMAVMTQLGNSSAAPDAVRAELYLKMAEERGETDARRLFDTMIQQKTWHFLPPVQK